MVLRLLVSFMLVMVGGCEAVAPQAPAAPPAQLPVAGPDKDACLLIDSDAANDDLRAIAAVLRQRHVVVIVATTGISRADYGASVLAHLASADGRPVPVLVGASAPSPPQPDWLGEARHWAELFNGLFTASVPMGPPDINLAADVERLTAGCARVDVMAIAPWSSFAIYAPHIASRLGLVIAQGQPRSDDPKADPGFNCGFDLAACLRAPSLLPPGRQITWVDVPETDAAFYGPRQEVFAKLSDRGLPGVVKAAMTAKPKTLVGTYLWDDSVALYLLHPEAFEPQGRHLGPKVAPAGFSALWLDAVEGK